MLESVSVPAVIPVGIKGKRVSCKAASGIRKSDQNTIYRVFLCQAHNIVRSAGECKSFLCAQGVDKLWIEK